MSRQRVTRSRTGCWTCRKRKVKCDETHPICIKCVEQRFPCDWPTAPVLATRTSSLWNVAGGVRPQRSAPYPDSTFQPHSQSGLGLASAGTLYSRTGIVIRPPLSRQEVECANSFIMSPQDQRFLQYFSSTALACTLTFGDWDTLQYLVRELAPSSSLITRMVLAVSATEMHRNGLPTGSNGEDPGGVDPGLRHYNAALKLLRDKLAKPIGLEDEEGVDVMIATVFFMVQYELQFSSSSDRIKTHLAGLWALISNHPLFQPQTFDNTIPGDPQKRSMESCFSLSCQLILWILYTDITATGSGGSKSLLKLLETSNSPLLEPSRVCSTARAGTSKIWGPQYPPSRVVADMELNGTLEFGHQLLALRFHIWDVKARGEAENTGNTNTASSLGSELQRLGDKYFDILIVADGLASMPWNRAIETVVRIAAFYWATVLYYRRMLGDPGPQDDFHRDTVAKLTKVLFTRYERDSEIRRQGRIVWATFLAAIETPDPIHRSWLLKRLKEARHLTIECEWVCSTTEKILEIQTAPGIPWVELAGYMQSRDTASV